MRWLVVAAQSIGEPATQMTLDTLYFPLSWCQCQECYSCCPQDEGNHKCGKENQNSIIVCIYKTWSRQDKGKSKECAVWFGVRTNDTNDTKVWYDPDPMGYSQNNEKLMKRLLGYKWMNIWLASWRN